MWSSKPLAAVIVIEGSANPNWTHIQGALSTSGSGTTVNVAFPAPVTNGNIVVGGLLLVSGALPTSVTDDKGNAYVFVNSGVSTNTVAGFRSVGPITNGAQTLTFIYQTSSTVWILIDEFSAGFPLSSVSLDGFQIELAGTAQATPNFQAFKSNDLLYCASFCSVAVTTGSGWTTAQGSGGQQMSEWKQAVSPGIYNGAFAFTPGSNWATVFGITLGPRTSWQLIQKQQQRTATNVTSATVSFPAAVASGNIVIGGIAVGTGAGNISDITSIVDDKGNNYSIIAPNINGRAIFWSNGTLTNGPTTITCTCSVTETVIFFLVNEFIPPPSTTTYTVDGTPTMVTPAGSPFNSGSVTTTISNGDLLYSFADLFGSGVTPINLATLNGETTTWCDGFLIQQSAGTAQAQWQGGAGAANAIALVAISATAAFPNASNTGVTNGTSLTASGQVELVAPTDNGATVQALDISTTGGNEAMGVTAHNVIIRNCKIHNTTGTTNSWVLSVTDGATSVQFINCEIYGNPSNTVAGPVISLSNGSSTPPSSVTFKACNIHGMVHGADLTNVSGTILFQDCYFHAEASANVDPHFDCAYYGGGSTADIEFQHCTFENLNTQTAGCFVENFSGAVNGVTINNCLFNTFDATGTGTLQGFELRGDKSAATVSNITFTNNAMVFPGGSGAYFNVVSATIATFSGNYDYNTNAPITSF